MTCATKLETSCCFQANLGRLSEAAEDRWRAWASQKCDDFLLPPRGEEGEWILHARRAVESDAKTLQKLLRTLGSHWKMKIQNEAGRNWLRLITPEAFAQAPGHDSNPEVHEEGAPEPQASVWAQGRADSEADIAPELQNCSSTAPCQILLQLSRDFDARAREMHAALQACH